MPQKLIEGYLIPLFQKGCKQLCSNNKGIFVASPRINSFGRILINRLEYEYKGIWNQSDFLSRNILIWPHFCRNTSSGETQREKKTKGIHICGS